jgi:hypothetical protein
MQARQLEAQKVQQTGQIAAQKMQLEQQIAAQTDKLDRYKANLDAQVRVYVEQMKQGHEQQSQLRQFAAEDRRLTADMLNTDPGTAGSLIQTTQDLAAGMQAMQASLAQQVAGLASAISAPKRVVRDPRTNKVIGVEPVAQPVVDPDAAPIQ